LIVATEMSALTRLVYGALIWVVASCTLPAQAQILIRDAEIEQSLKQIAAPLFAASGINARRLKILIIQDSKLNAFVADDRHIFLNTGLLLKLKTPDMVQAVLAHEIAHIRSGHLVRRQLNLQSASSAARLGLLLSALAAAAGAGEASAGILFGTASLAQRRFFTHTRAEEAAADQIGLRYMANAGLDPRGASKVMEIFAGQEALSGGRQDPYVRTHPFSRDRLRSINSIAAGYLGNIKPEDPTVVYWHKRLRAKLEGFVRNPNYLLRNASNGNNDEISTLRRAIAYHRLPDQQKAQAAVNRLLDLQPEDPYYHELKGQMLLETGNAAGAVASYSAAVELAPREALLLAGLGRAQLALGTKSGNKSALASLEKARSRDPKDPRMMRDLGVAYARAGKNGHASLLTAERYALLGNFETARTHANRAQGQLPNGSGAWLRAQEVLDAVKWAEKAKK
jgi:predicted Zn-dependent protease